MVLVGSELLSAGEKKLWAQRKKRSSFLGRNKKAFDAELWVILETLDITVEEIQKIANTSVTIFCDSQEVLRTIESLSLHRKYKFLKDIIKDRKSVV